MKLMEIKSGSGIPSIIGCRLRQNQICKMQIAEWLRRRFRRMRIEALKIDECGFLCNNFYSSQLKCEQLRVCLNKNFN